jgi:hypothetical protein
MYNLGFYESRSGRDLDKYRSRWDEFQWVMDIDQNS